MSSIDLHKNITKEVEGVFGNVHKNFTKVFGTDDFYIAGGAIRDFVQGCQDPKDYDIFVTNKDAFIDISRALEKKGYNTSLIRDNSKVFEADGQTDIDLVKVDLDYINQTEPMDTFDLTCCTAQYGPNGFKCHPNFFDDVYDKVIEINNLKLPYYTYKRIAKHIRKGYTVSPQVLVDVMDFAVTEMDKEAKAEAAPVSNNTNSEKSSSL